MEEAARARVRCAWAKVQGVISYPDSPGCIIPHKGKDIQGLCPECIDIWDSGKRQALLSVVRGEFTDEDITPISFYPLLPTLD